MRSVLLRSLAVIGVGGLILAGVLYVASTVDARPPEVLEIRLTQPVADDPDLALITTSLEVLFNEPVDEASAEGALRIEPAVEGAVSWSGSTMIFTPVEPLDLDSTYEVAVTSGVRDPAGNAMTELPEPFTFATSGRPALVASEPADGGSDIGVDEPISLTFSTLMDTASVEEALRIRPSFRHDLRWSEEVLEIIPLEPMRAGAEYEISVQGDAADVAGVALGEPIRIAFRTTKPGLVADQLVPADGVDGIAVTTAIAVIFDRPVDPDSVDGDAITITPDVGGTVDVLALPDDPATEDGAGRVLRFTPASSLAPNTTFEVIVDAGIAASSGGTLARPLRWTFTTGAPVTAISNQITFITDRGGVPNVWAMNPDGTGQRQLSTELVPVVDYAVAPDGSSLVVADGRRLVYLRPDGSDRRVLTGAGHLEFDPTYAPNSQRVAFGRADAETGDGLGVWTWEVNGGDATRVELPRQLGDDPSQDRRLALRAPRYAPDGGALAFVDLDGWVSLLELPGQRLTRVPFEAAEPPSWLPDSGGLLVTGVRADGELPATSFTAPVLPLQAGATDAIHRLARSGTAVAPTSYGPGTRVAAVGPGGALATIDADGALRIADGPDGAPGTAIASGSRFAGAAFSPGAGSLVLVAGEEGMVGSLELLDLESGDRTHLARNGSRPRWLP